jgi:hypothetical protein
LPPSSSKVRNGWSCISSFSACFPGMQRDSIIPLDSLLEPCFNHLFVKMSTGYTSDITYIFHPYTNEWRALLLYCHGIRHKYNNTSKFAVKFTLSECNIITYIPLCICALTVCLIVMHTTNTLCTASVSVLVFSGQNRPLSQIIIQLPVLVSGTG